MKLIGDLLKRHELKKAVAYALEHEPDPKELIRLYMAIERDQLMDALDAGELATKLLRRDPATYLMLAQIVVEDRNKEPLELLDINTLFEPPARHGWERWLNHFSANHLDIVVVLVASAFACLMIYFSFTI